MGIFEVIKAAAKEAVKPEGYVKGEKFESYAQELFGASNLWILVKRTSDYNHNAEMYEHSSLEPDFRFKHKLSNKQINIECKYRTSLNKEGMLDWCREDQFKRYKETDKYNNTYVLIGLGGEPKAPEKLFLIKLSEIKYTKLYPSVLDKYKIRTNCLFDMKDGRIIQLDEGLSKTLILKNKLTRIGKFFK